MEAGGEPAKFAGAIIVVTARFFGDVADALAKYDGVFVGIESQDFGIATIDGQEARENPHGGRFAGAVFAQKRENRAGRNVERDAAEDVFAAVAFADVLEPGERGPYQRFSFWR